MYTGRLNATGELTDIGQRDPSDATDVNLLTLPIFNGPFGYDALNQVAIPLPKTNQSDLQKLQSIPMDTKLLYALTLRASTAWTNAPAPLKAKIQNIIDSASLLIVNALS